MLDLGDLVVIEIELCERRVVLQVFYTFDEVLTQTQRLDAHQSLQVLDLPDPTVVQINILKKKPSNAYQHCVARLLLPLMVCLHCRTRIPNPMGTLYYAEVFILVQIPIWIPTRMVSQMVTVPILGTDLHPRDRCPSKFYYFSIRGSESGSEPMGNFCIVK